LIVLGPKSDILLMTRGPKMSISRVSLYPTKITRCCFNLWTLKMSKSKHAISVLTVALSLVSSSRSVSHVGRKGYLTSFD